ncbi:MAG: glycosyltransferase family 2 protein, partial [Oscillospiraceae bacterium]|nr:glycosyltransferase family 2 protein [Oscillospiraceae bacterium]
MKQPLISVVVAIYNVAQYLPRAVESVISQSIGFENIQLLLCDDCSTDESFALAQQYAAQYPENILVLQAPQNSGACGAPRNMGIAAAAAPYLFFLDGDDWLYPDALGALYDAAEQSGADLVQGAYSNDYSDGRCEAASAAMERAGIAAGSYSFLQQDPALFLACTCPVWDKLYRAEPFHTHRLRFSEGDLGEDMVAPNLYNLLSDRVLIIDTPITHYNRRDDSITAGATESTVWKRLHAAHRLLAEDAERLGLSERCCRLCLPAAMLERYP